MWPPPLREWLDDSLSSRRRALGTSLMTPRSGAGPTTTRRDSRAGGACSKLTTTSSSSSSSLSASSDDADEDSVRVEDDEDTRWGAGAAAACECECECEEANVPEAAAEVSSRAEWADTALCALALSLRDGVRESDAGGGGGGW